MIALSMGDSMTTLFITIIVSGILLLLLLLFYYISLAIDSWDVDKDNFKEKELKSLDESNSNKKLKEDKEEIRKGNIK